MKRFFAYSYSFFLVGLVAAISVTSFRSWAASPQQVMSCLVGLYTAQDAMGTSADPNRQPVRVDIPLASGDGSVEVVIEGRKVAIEIQRKSHLDLYSATFLLMYEPGKAPPRSLAYEALLFDYIYLDGKPQSSWDSLFGQTQVAQLEVFPYLNRGGGALVLTPGFVEKLKQAGKWGVYPFTSNTLELPNSLYVTDAAVELAQRRLLDSSDVISIYTVLGCNRWLQYPRTSPLPPTRP